MTRDDVCVAEGQLGIERVHVEDVALVGELAGALSEVIAVPDVDAAKLAVTFYLARHDRAALARRRGPWIARARPSARS